MELVEKQAGRWQQTSTQRPCSLPSFVPYFDFDKPTKVVHKTTVKRCAVERAYDSQRLVVRTAITQHVREEGFCVNDERHGTETGGEFVSGMSKVGGDNVGGYGESVMTIYAVRIIIIEFAEG